MTVKKQEQKKKAAQRLDAKKKARDVALKQDLTVLSGRRAWLPRRIQQLGSNHDARIPHAEKNKKQKREKVVKRSKINCAYA
jgi:hypothetical protein